MKKISVVIPCYNEEETVEHLINRLKLIHESLISQIQLEVILVDDHSKDRTPFLIKEYCIQFNWIKYMRLSRNCGSHIATIAGLSKSTGDCAIFLAADLQDPPELIHDMLLKWKEGFAVVWAVRKTRIGVSRFSVAMSNLFYYLLNKMSEVNFPSKGADYALLDRKAVDALVSSAGSKPSIGALISWIGFKQTEIEYVKEERKYGVSKWTLSKKLNAFADAFVGFSYLPMRFMSTLGFAAAFIGFIYAAFVLIGRFVVGSPIPGYASLMIVVLIIGGLQMLMLGVLGEYLWRNLEESRRRPLFLIEDKTGFEE